MVISSSSVPVPNRPVGPKVPPLDTEREDGVDYVEVPDETSPSEEGLGLVEEPEEDSDS